MSGTLLLVEMARNRRLVHLRPLKRVIKDTISRYRHKDALRIEDTLHKRLQELLAKQRPDIKVKLHRWQGTILYDVYWGGSFTVLVYLDGTCFCGMSFDLLGGYLIISQMLRSTVAAKPTRALRNIGCSPFLVTYADTLIRPVLIRSLLEAINFCYVRTTVALPSFDQVCFKSARAPMSEMGLGRVKMLRWAGRNLGMLVTCEGFSALTMP